MARKNFEAWSREELIREIEKLNKRKKYGIVWEDKLLEDVVEQCKESLPVLIEDKSKEIVVDGNHPTNVLIEGDNYHALSVLNYTHKGRIDVIYIDPPYNTGSEDFIYNDKIVDIEDVFRHSKWLSFMEKRLRLAKNLLTPEGFIFISIDDNEYAQLKLLTDEIFLEKNYIGTIARRRRDSQANLSKNLSTIHEYILCYARGNSGVLNKISHTINESEYSNPDKDPRGPYVTMPCSNKGGAQYEIVTPTGKKHKDEWRFTRETFNALLEDKRIVFPKSGDGKPRYKLFLNEKKEKGVIPNSWWDNLASNQEATNELKDIFNGKAVFDNPKPVGLIEAIINLAIKSEGIALDFFAGSGSTGHAVLNLNSKDNGRRSFILCTDDENSICSNVCYPRIKKVIKGYTDASGIAMKGKKASLKYFKTDFVDAKYTDRNKKRLVDKSTEMLCLKEDCFNEIKVSDAFKVFNNPQGKYMGIIYDDEGIEGFKKELKKIDRKVVVYVFSLDDSAREEEFEDVANLVELKPIPAVILNVYRKIFK